MVSKKFVWAILIGLLAIAYAHADTTEKMGAFDAIVNLFANATGTWGSKLKPVVQFIFWTISMLEFLWQVVIKKIFSGDIKKFWVFLMVRLTVTSLFASIFLYTSFYISIVNYITSIGASIQGIDVSIKEGANLSISFSVSKIFALLWSKYALLLAGLAGSSVGAGLLSKVPIVGGVFGPLASYLMWIAFAILAGMIIICITFVLTLIQAYIIIFGGIILAGFSGSTWTFNYWQRYLGYVGGIAIQLFTSCLILGIITGSLKNGNVFATFAYDTKNATAFLGSVVESLVGTAGMIFVYAALITTIPIQARAMLNGTVEGGLGTAIGGVASLASGGSYAQGVSRVVTAGFGKSSAGGAGGMASGMANSARQSGRSTMMSGAKHSATSGGKSSLSDSDWKDQLKSTDSSVGKSSAQSSSSSSMSRSKRVAKGLAQMKQAGSSLRVNADRTSVGSAPNINANPHRE